MPYSQTRLRRAAHGHCSVQTEMSKQRDMLGSLVAEITSRFEGCSVLLMGSVQHGTERADSDVDLLIVVPDIARVMPQVGTVVHRTDVVKVVEANVNGVDVTFNFIDSDLFGDMRLKPWKYYQFAAAEVLHDGEPSIASVRETIHSWFATRPDVAELWDNQEQQYERWRRAKRVEGRDIPLEFPYSTDFADHVDRMIAAAAHLAGHD